MRDFTTGELARAWGCSASAIVRAIDAGALPGYRVPCSRYRRVPRRAARRYALAHGLPPPEGVCAETYLTTGDVARRTTLSVQAVIASCDAGDLRCHRVPGSHARRVRREDARAWAQRHGLPWREKEVQG